ncbi:MFS transporter [Microbispora sp. NEAU-D428]|uniref:MFS transporter n=1 Tax=Microbispora sitophila TaxID=2771537 RepID=UPI001868159A|nr:MFS transporter [Microbispora sitophila]MBE3015240.1 MFS transporter [Microbispora sitophila]
MTSAHADIQTRTLRKVTRKFIPLITLCYIVLYLDRQNVAVAALTMNKQLGIGPAVYGLIAGVFFWTYSLFEIPSNYIVSRIGVRIWVSRIIVSWGLVTMATAAAAGENSLLVLRLLLGLAEAGFSPAMLFLIASWFPPGRRAMTMSLMAVAVPLAAVGTPVLTSVMTGMDGLLGMAGWRWLFLLSGLPAVVLGFFFYKVIRNGPEDAAFLSLEERDWLRAELSREHATLGVRGDRFRHGVMNPRVLVLVVVYILFAFSLFGYQFFIPQILQQFGLGTNAVGWVAALPPLLAIGPMVWWARHSDRTKERSRHFAAAAATAGVGFLLAGLLVHHPAPAIAGLCVAGIGLYSCIATQLAIPSTFLSGAALAAGLATINGLGNIGGYFGPQITGLIRGATGDFAAALLVMGATILTASGVALLLDHRLRRAGVTTSPKVAIDAA